MKLDFYKEWYDEDLEECFDDNHYFENHEKVKETVLVFIENHKFPTNTEVLYVCRQIVENTPDEYIDYYPDKDDNEEEDFERKIEAVADVIKDYMKFFFITVKE